VRPLAQAKSRRQRKRGGNSQTHNKARMTKPLPLWNRNREASSNINSEVESALSAAAGIALTFAEKKNAR